MTAESHDSSRRAAAVEDAGLRLVFAALVIDWRPASPPPPHPTPPGPDSAVRLPRRLRLIRWLIKHALVLASNQNGPA